MDAKRLTEWLTTAEGLGKSVVACLGIPALVWAAVSKMLTPLGLPTWTTYASAGAVVVVILLFLLASFLRFAKASRLERPDAFQLRPNDPGSLIGRGEDLAKIHLSVKHHRLVLLDGESGCGKSALVFAGLIPVLQAETGGLLPVAFRDWGDDWIRGPLAAVLDALHRSVSDRERETLGWRSAPDLAAGTAGLVSALEAHLDAVFVTLRRRVLLIADQFDDHQAQHRERFLDAESNWLSPKQLAASNAFWNVVRTRLVDQRLHLLVITRADTAAGLACVRFLGEDQMVARTLPRVDGEFLRPLLATIAPAGVEPPIVSNPGNGWEDLREQLERDLKIEGAILMQQVRTVLLGLRQLPLLTPRRYRIAGGLRGVETLVILRALRRAGAAVGGGDAGARVARAILNAMLLQDGPNRLPKSRRASLAALSELAGSREQAETVLRILQEDELVRPAELVGAAPTWQLDHDYLARAALQEARQSDRWSLALREGYARYQEAAGDARQRRASLLPFRILVRIGWEWHRKRLEFGVAARYARASAIRPAVVVAVLVVLAALAPVAYDEGVELAEVYAAAYGLNDPRNASGSALLVWRNSDSFRSRVYRRINPESPTRESAGYIEQVLMSNWPYAHAGLEPRRALEAATALRGFIAKEGDRDFGQSLVSNYGLVSTRLDRDGVSSEEAALRAAMALNRETGMVADDLMTAYAAIARRLDDPQKSKEAAAILRKPVFAQSSFSSSDRTTGAYLEVVARLDEGAQRKEVDAILARIGERPDAGRDATTIRLVTAIFCKPAYAADARRLAVQLRGRLTVAIARPDGDLLPASEPLYRSLVRCLSPADARAEASVLLDALGRDGPARVKGFLASAYMEATTRLEDPRDLAEAARVLRVGFSGIGRDPVDSMGYYTQIAARLAEADATGEARVLRDQIEHATDPVVAGPLVTAHAAIARRLQSAEEARFAMVHLRDRIDQVQVPPEEDVPVDGSNDDSEDLGLLFAMGATDTDYTDLAPYLSEDAARAEAGLLRQRLERTEPGRATPRLVAAYVSVARRLRAEDLASATQFVHALLMQRLPRDPTTADEKVKEWNLKRPFDLRRFQPYADAYVTLASLLDAGSARAEADAWRPWVYSNERSWALVGAALPYAAVVARQDDTRELEKAAARFERLLVGEWSMGPADQFARAYGRVVAALLVRADAARRRDLTLRIVTLAGHPFLTDPDALLVALTPAAARDFNGDAAAAARWAEATYGFRPAQFRPSSHD